MISRFTRRCTSSSVGRRASTAAAASASARPQLRFDLRSVPRTGWKLPPLGVGAFDGITLDAPQRSENLFGCVMRSGARLVMLQGDSLASGATGSSSWESVALKRVLSAGKVARDDLIISATFAADASQPLLQRVQAAARHLGVERFDIVVVSITGADSAMIDSQLLSSFAAAEAVIDAGLAQAFALHAADWHALDAPAQPGKPPVSGSAAGTSLRRVLLLLQQHGSNRRAAAAASAALAADTSGAGKEGHRCIALYSPASLAKPDVLLPSVVDSSGRPWSIAELAERYGLALMLTSPLDCLLPAAEFEERFLKADPTLERPAAVPGTDERRPFRCVDAPLHRDSHPSRIAALLNDVVNYAIHCEVMWGREVREAVRAEKAAATSNAAAAPAAALLEGPAFAAAATAAAPDALRADVLGGLPPAPAAAGAGDGAAASPASSDLMPMGAADSLPGLAVDDLQPDDMAWGQMLPFRFNHPGFLTLAEWQHLRAHRIVPSMGRVAAVTRGVAVSREWSHAYRGLLSELVALVNMHVEQTHGHRAAHLAQRLQALIDEHSAALAPAGGASASASAPTSSSASRLAAAVAAVKGSQSKSDAGNWGRPAAAPLQALVARLFLAFPNVFLLSEVPELHQLMTRPDARVRVEKDAGKLLGDRDGGSGNGSGSAGKDAGASAPSDAESSGLSVAAAQRVLLSLSQSGLVMEAATLPLPEWPDALQGVPLQVELAPIQERLRQLRAKLAASSPVH